MISAQSQIHPVSTDYVGDLIFRISSNHKPVLLGGRTFMSDLNPCQEMGLQPLRKRPYSPADVPFAFGGGASSSNSPLGIPSAVASASCSRNSSASPSSSFTCAIVSAVVA